MRIVRGASSKKRSTGETFRCSAPGCAFVGTVADFGRRKDGRRNTWCATCRSRRATEAVRVFHATKRRYDGRRDLHALRVVERWCGMRYRQWITPEGKRWQELHGIDLESVWTYRMQTLAAREAREIAAARAAHRARHHRAVA